MKISMSERRPLLRALSLALVRRLVQLISREHAEVMAAGYLEDLGEPDCPVCLANRRRQSFTVTITNETVTLA